MKAIILVCLIGYAAATANFVVGLVKNLSASKSSLSWQTKHQYTHWLKSPRVPKTMTAHPRNVSVLSLPSLRCQRKPHSLSVWTQLFSIRSFWSVTTSSTLTARSKYIRKDPQADLSSEFCIWILTFVEMPNMKSLPTHISTLTNYFSMTSLSRLEKMLSVFLLLESQLHLYPVPVQLKTLCHVKGNKFEQAVKDGMRSLISKVF